MNTELFSLKNRVALITGGAGTLGKQYGATLAAAGAHVVIGDISLESCQKVAEQISHESGNEALGVELDVSNHESVKRAFAAVTKKYSHIDVLINNAGVSGKYTAQNVAPTFTDYPLSEWEKAFAVNITGMFLCAQEALKHMLVQHNGIIVNISSTYGIVGPDQRIYEKDAETSPGFIKPVSYAVTKSAVLNFTRYLATLYAKDGIRVNTLSPGGVDDGTLDDEFKKKYSDKTPLARMARPDEYNGAMLFLCSPASSYMTGANLIVDGGWTAW